MSALTILTIVMAAITGLYAIIVIYGLCKWT